MADDLEKQANDAFIDDEFDRAVELYTRAITAEPSRSASLLSSRAQAHIKLKNFTDAIADANRAIELNPSNSKAFLRKGMACYELEEYETARVAFAAGAKLEPSSSLYQSWIRKCDSAIEAENAENTSIGAQAQEAALPGSTNGNSLNAGNMSMESTAQVETKPAQSFRHAYYQSTHEVVVEIFAKNLKPEQVKVDFGVQSLRAVIDCPANEPFIFQTRLNQKVVIEKCKFCILSTKLEIRLAKAESLHWKSLEYNESQMVAAPPPTITKSVMETKLDYPSSSKRGHKDWDKLEAQVKKEEKDEKLEGDAALNKLFRDIYSNADEDTRRAMNKSFVESSGTVLSTNWKDVGKKYVEGSPPSGMEMKKWEM